MALMTFDRLGFPPERLSTVNCSSGPRITNSGPNTTLEEEESAIRQKLSLPNIGISVMGGC